MTFRQEEVDVLGEWRIPDLGDDHAVIVTPLLHMPAGNPFGDIFGAMRAREGKCSCGDQWTISQKMVPVSAPVLLWIVKLVFAMMPEMNTKLVVPPWSTVVN